MKLDRNYYRISYQGWLPNLCLGLLFRFTANFGSLYANWGSSKKSASITSTFTGNASWLLPVIQSEASIADLEGVIIAW